MSAKGVISSGKEMNFGRDLLGFLQDFTIEFRKDSEGTLAEKRRQTSSLTRA